MEKVNVHTLCFVIWTCAVLTCASQSHFYTCGVDVCNEEKYCDATTRRCEWCANKQQDCFTERHIANCTKFCRELPCKPLEVIPHGSLSGFDNNYGTVVQYTCDVGYSMVGSNATTCVELQQWSDPPPLCQANECPLPKPIRNGWIHVSDDVVKYLPGINISYNCNDGYTLVGDTNLTCLLGPSWGNDVPTCQAVMCPLPKSIRNGRIYVPDGVKSYQPGITIAYYCNDMYVLRGAANLTCLSGSTWDNEIPVCELQSVQNGWMIATLTLIGAAIVAVLVAIGTCQWHRRKRQVNFNVEENEDTTKKTYDEREHENKYGISSQGAPIDKEVGESEIGNRSMSVYEMSENGLAILKDTADHDIETETL